MQYSPERVYAYQEGDVRIFDEMWTGEWWWNKQANLPDRATIAPIILASDKTKLSQFKGNQTAWPVYLSIGNIAKATRRQVSARATVLVGYIPVSKLQCFSSKARSVAGYRLFHHCMMKILEPLVEAGRNGIKMLCVDGCIRKVYPIVAAYVADHPEQCLIVNVKENHCPRGLVDPKQHGEPDACLLQNVDETLDILLRHAEGLNEPRFVTQGLHPVYEPFWKNLPHCNIFSCVTPDILHQLHKGIFKDHLVSWCAKLIGDDELDRRFKAMPDMPGLRHFKKGITSVSQWTGAEHKEMQKVFVALLSGAVSNEVLTVVQAVVDFIYYAQFQVHTTTTLRGLQHALQTFHDHKEIFQTLGIREHFNIAKIHSMLHYLEAIIQRGCLDSFNTELSERLHIDFTKEGYRAGNHRDYIAHMTTWLRRQEAMHLRSAFLQWLDQDAVGLCQPLPDTLTNSDTDSEPGDIDLDGLNAAPVEKVEKELPLVSPISGVTYRIAKNCPNPCTTLLELQGNKLPCSPFLPTHLTRYEVYKQVKIEKLPNEFVGDITRFDRIRAVPMTAAKGRTRPVPAQFATALVIHDRELFKGRISGSLEGLRAARVRVIFKLPPQFGDLPHPLAYVEWYTAFNRVDTTTVGVDQIYGACHLVPKFGSQIDRKWTVENVLNAATQFFVNPYLSIHTFASSELYTRGIN
ncbi:unnamed protein product [Somion occarium]|uniref:Uncharacterized protein n=1 Tax=Somion occarium TaxID=3059160 RepID=A0ABP1DXM6_9APHY